MSPYPGESYTHVTGQTNETEAEQRARHQREIRTYSRANNPPEVVAEMERRWSALDRQQQEWER